MTYVEDVITQIRKVFHTLHKAEQKVAEIVLNDLHFAAQASITDLAERAQVSESSVTRFTRALGYKGIKELKYVLAQSLAVGNQYLSNNHRQSSDSPASQVLNDIFEALNAARSQLDESLINDAAALITEARRIFIFGSGGNSSSIARDSEHRLFRLNLMTSSHTEAVMQCMAASTAEKGDIILAISLTGENASLNNNIRVARQYEATVISITRPNTELASLSHLCLPVYIRDSDNILKPNAMRYAVMAILDVLYTEVARQLGDQSTDSLRRIRHNLNNLLGSVEAGPVGD